MEVNKSADWESVTVRLKTREHQNNQFGFPRMPERSQFKVGETSSFREVACYTSKYEKTAECAPGFATLLLILEKQWIERGYFKLTTGFWVNTTSSNQVLTKKINCPLASALFWGFAGTPDFTPSSR